MKKNYFYNLFYQLLLLFIPTVTAPYVSRVLGPEGVGVYSYTNSIVTYFVLLSVLGTSTYGQKEIAQNREDKKKLSEVFWGIEFVSIASTVICLFLWLVLILGVKQYKEMFIVLSLTILSSMLDITWFFRGLDKFRTIVIYSSAVKLAGLILTFILVRKKEDLVLYIMIVCLTGLFSNLLLWIKLPPHIEKVKWKDVKLLFHFRQTLIYFIPTVAVSVYTVFDKTMLGIISDSSYENGYYEQASKVISIAKTLPLSLNSVMASSIAFLFARKKMDDAAKYLNRGIEYVLFTSIPVTFGICAVSPHFVTVFFGQGYEKVISLLVLSAPLVVIVGLSSSMGMLYYIPSGQRKKSNKVICLGAALNILLNLLFIPKYLSYGAVLSSVVTESLITFLFFYLGRDVLQLKNICVNTLQKILAAAIMYIIVRELVAYLKCSLTSLCIEIVCGVIVYFVIVFFMKKLRGSLNNDKAGIF